MGLLFEDSAMFSYQWITNSLSWAFFQIQTNKLLIPSFLKTWLKTIYLVFVLKRDPWKAGRTAVSFEIEDDAATQDMLSPQGFANAVYQTLRLRAGSGCHHAPVCSSWIWMIPDSNWYFPFFLPLGKYQSWKNWEVLMTTTAILLWGSN